MTQEQTKFIPPLNEPPIGTSGTILYDNKIVNGKIFKTRGHTGDEFYGIVEPPNSRPFTRFSVFRIKEKT